MANFSVPISASLKLSLCCVPMFGFFAALALLLTNPVHACVAFASIATRFFEQTVVL